MPRRPIIGCLPRYAAMVAWTVVMFGAADTRGAEKGLQSGSAAANSQAIEFFETKVRPLLAENCFECHSSKSKQLQAGLRLDSRATMLEGSDSSGGVVVPGKPNESPLVHAIRWETSEMPPRGKLRDEQIAVLVKWIEMGAPWPAADELAHEPVKMTTYDWDRLRSGHWAFQPIRRPPSPPVADRAWPRSELDTFVLARLEDAGLRPSLPAPARVIVRRLYYDLIGLPPAPAEVEAFQRAAAKNRQAAVDALVDRLLSSPHYGERWGRHWLDVARYNDGYGGDFDDKNQPLTGAWRYRDWVVEALNRDLPIDEFLRLQIAGDLVGRQHDVATGFLALGPTYISDGGDPDSVAQAAAETLDDRVDTLSRGLLGLTVSCARCHDHKFDPVPQLDYYSLAGVLRSSRGTEVPLAAAAEVARYDDFQRRIHETEEKIRRQAAAAAKEKRKLSAAEQKQFEAWKAEQQRLTKEAPARYAFCHALADGVVADMPLAVRGNPRKPGPLAPRRMLRIVTGEQAPRFTQGSGRLELAHALTSQSNPLTARVFVNRVWMWYFGQGLVRTPSNFGKLGEPPTHPELLDWLADHFTAAPPHGFGWSLKRLHREIVRSATYQMDSRIDPRSFAADGDNRLLWRMNRRRLDVEAWRDGLLSVSGELDETLGGEPSPNLAQSHRRTIYGLVSRRGDAFESDHFLRLFDFPQARTTSEGRSSGAVPQQALFLLNHEFMAARARALAARLERAVATDAERIELAYQLLYARPVTPAELDRGMQFVRRQSSVAAGRLSPWQQYAQVLLSASEMMYLD